MDWIEFGKLVGALAAAIAVVVAAVWTLVRPACDAFIHSCNARNREKLKKLIDDLYANEFKDRAAAASDARQALALGEANSDSLRALQVAIERQGSEIKVLPQIADALERHSETFTSLTTTLGEMQREQGEQGRLLSEITGFLRGKDGGSWDGNERRGGGL
jgi:predicted O-linked N-acetylglucosamine transferase (SPINDLY family)